MSEPHINPIAKNLMSHQPPPQRNRRRRTPFFLRKWFLIFVGLCVVAGVVGVLVLMSIVKPLAEQAETFDLEGLHKIEKASQILDRRGDELGRIYMLNRTPIKIEQVPMHFIQALTAEEDSRFFQHGGVDMVGVLRAIWLNYKAGAETQGASTLTQQLARQAFKLKDLEAGENNSRYTRKIVEWYLAERIEEKYSKSEILELYLNRIYFGAGFYGIQAASQGYFSKNVEDLTLEESAVLCGLIKSPNNIQPFRNPERAMKARNHVYFRMVEEGSLSKSEREALSIKPVVTAPRGADSRLSYVYEEIRQAAEQIVGQEESLMGGFHIYTTIDAKLQKAAEVAVKKQMEEIEQRPDYAHQTYAQYRKIMENYRKKLLNKTLPQDAPKPQPEYLQASVLAIDNHNGGILAMVGGRDFVDSMFNRALQSRRPTGTAFIPFVYATAFESPEFFPAMQLEDGPIDNRRVMIGGLTGILGEWGTEQKETVYASQITAREALVQSRNAATVRLGERVTLPAVKDLATRAGIKSALRDYPSTFLGASEAKLDEMTLAYSTFPNKGKRPSALSLIQRITNDAGKVIYQVKGDAASMVPVMDEIAAYQTHSSLVDALSRGTGKAASEEFGLGKFPAAGKTGTHYEFKDLWFFGYSSEVTCGVWCGFDQQKPIYTGAFSNRIALPIWTNVMNAAAKTYTPEEFAEPKDARFVEVCRTSGQRATDACYEKVPDGRGGMKAVRNTNKEVLRVNSVFDTYCTVHSSNALPRDMLLFRSNDDAPGNTYQIGGQTAHAEPVRMQGLTIIGNDPYNAVQPVLRAEPVNEDGTKVMRAEPVEDTSEKLSPIKLAPPPPLKLD